MYRLLVSAKLTLDLATPMESAGASFDDRHLLGLEASAAAHQIAAVDSDARVVALSAVRAEDAQFRVLLAERRGRLQVDEILGPGRLMLGVVRFQMEVVPLPATQAVAVPVHRIAGRVARDRVPIPANAVRVAHHHPGRAVETVLQIIADHAEVRQPYPTSLDGAGPGHAVAFALLPHFRRHVLQQKAKVRCYSGSLSVVLSVFRTGASNCIPFTQLSHSLAESVNSAK